MIASTFKLITLEIELKLLQLSGINISAQHKDKLTSLRSSLFKLEAFLRLFRKSSTLSQQQLLSIQKTLAQVKLFEDLLGSWELQQQIDPAHSHPLNLKVQKKINQPAWRKPLEAQILKPVLFFKLIEPNDSADLILKNLQKIINRTQDKVSQELTPQFQASDFSHHSMEEYFHDFRRSIRWIAITIQLFPELFCLTPLPSRMSPEIKKLCKKMENNRFAHLPHHQCPIEIDRIKYYQLSETIDDAGRMKDSAEILFLKKVKSSNISKLKQPMLSLMNNYIQLKLNKKLIQ